MAQTINIANIEYYDADDVYRMEPDSFTGCSKTSRLIVSKKKLRPEDYVYMKYIKSTDQWEPSTRDYKKAKVLLTKQWVHANLIMFKAIKTDDDMKIEAMRAPPLIELADTEKFVDADGNRLDIEVRGTKSVNDIYFNVKDVGDRFKIGDVKNTLVHPDGKFLLDVHYSCLLYTSPSPRDRQKSRMPSSA